LVPDQNQVRIITVLARGLRKRCPQCGIGVIYDQWNKLRVQCQHCGCELERRGGDTWFFTYMSTAFLTGVIILWMFLYPMTEYLTGQIIIIIAWFVLIVLTLPHRKGLAIAIDYLIENFPMKKDPK
jgi:uncharacterized protein (DUF983 family)